MSTSTPRSDLVMCMQCGNQVPLNQTDIVGQGYRCMPCSQRAEVSVLQGATDGAHMSSSSLRGARGNATASIVIGIGSICVGGWFLVSTDGQVGKFLAIGGAISLVGGLIRSGR
jgi:hypothetical protein